MKRKSTLCLLLGAVMLFAPSAYIRSAIITTSDDGSIRNGESSTVQYGGTGETLRVRRDNDANNSQVRKAYLKFDLTGENADLTQSATFNTTIGYRSANQNGNRIFYFYGLDSGFTPSGSELGTDWDETALTWNNAPGNDDSVDIDTGFDAATTTLIYTASNQYNKDVGDVYNITIPTLGDFVQADNTVTLMISWSDTVEYGFASKENPTASYRPTLEFSQIPESGTLALMLLSFGAFCILKVRRR